MSESTGTRNVIEAFNEAFGRHDVEAVMRLMTEDCLFENTFPAPDGVRYQGQADVRAFWESFFASTPSARFETEELVCFEDRAFARWVFHWADEPEGGHVRGVDVFKVADGRVAEKLSYVKG